jgi:hypothetical protein
MRRETAFLAIMSACLAISVCLRPATCKGVGAEKNIPSADASKTVSTTIIPGVGLRNLALGDSRQRFLQLFPAKKNVDQSWNDACGSEHNWVDPSPPGGNVFVRFTGELISQFEFSSTRFHTAEGITPLDPPQRVRESFPGLKAFVFLGYTSTAMGDRPLVFWIDERKGIAFKFAYFPEEQRRYLYGIIIFKPHTQLCPEGSKIDSTDWRELPAYSLEPPDRTARIPSLTGPDFALVRKHQGKRARTGVWATAYGSASSRM